MTATIQSDGFAISGNSTEAELRADVGEPAAPTEKPAAVTPEPSSASPSPDPPVAEAEPTDAELDTAGLERNPDGTFKKRALLGRVNQLTAKFRAAERERDDLKRQLEARTQAPAPTTPAAPVAPAGDPEPDPTTFDGGEYDPKYNRAVAKWEVRQELKAAQAASAAQQQQATLAAAITRVNEAGAQAHPDYLAVMASADHSGLVFPPAVLDTIFSEPLGHEVAYHLVSHADDLRHLASLSPVAAARELGKLVARLDAAHTGPAPAVPRISLAKPPIQPVAGTPIVTDEPPDPDSLDLDAHVRYMNTHQRRR